MDRTLFFLHIPKTAGTTLTSVLRANFPPQAILSAYDHDALRRVDELDDQAAARLRLIQGHVFVADFERFFSRPVLAFTMLRDPVARVVSEYEFLRSWPEHHLYEYLNRQDVGLAEYVSSCRPELKWRGKNLMTRSLCGAVPPDCPGEEMLARATANLDRFHVAGVTELFDESLLLLRRAAGLGNILYERRNRRAAPRRPEDLTQAEREAVLAHNQLDQALYAHARRRLLRETAALGGTFTGELWAFRALNTRYQSICDKVLAKSGVERRAKGYTLA